MDFFSSPISEVLALTSETTNVEIPEGSPFHEIYSLNPFPKFSDADISKIRGIQYSPNSLAIELLKSGFSFPFISSTIENLKRSETKLSAFESLWILNTSISWFIFFEKTHDQNYSLSVLNSLTLACLGEFQKHACSMFTFIINTILEEIRDNCNMYIAPIIDFFNEDFYHPSETAQIIPNILLKLSNNTSLEVIPEDTVLILSSFSSWLGNESLKCSTRVIEQIIDILAASLLNLDVFSLKFLGSVIEKGSEKQFYFIFMKIAEPVCLLFAKQEKKINWEKPETVIELPLNQTVEGNIGLLSANVFPGGFKLQMPEFPKEVDLHSCMNSYTNDIMSFVTLPLKKKKKFTEIFLKKAFENMNKMQDNEAFGNIVIGVILNYEKLKGTARVGAELANSCIFDPRINIYSHPKGFEYINTIRNIAVKLILEDSSETVDILITKVHRYPLLFAETMYRLSNEIELLSPHIPRLFKCIRYVFLYYRTLDLLENELQKEIEIGRASLLYLIDKLADKEETCINLFNDSVILTSFLFLLSEPPLRSYAISLFEKGFLTVPMTVASGMIMNYVSLLANSNLNIEDERYVVLMGDLIFSLMSAIKKRRGLMNDFAFGKVIEYITDTLTRLDSSPRHIELLYSVLSFFIFISREMEISQTIITTITDVLMRLFGENPPQEVYEKLVKFMKSDNEGDLTPQFILKTPNAVKIYLRVFFNTSRFKEIFDFLTQMIDFSEENAMLTSKEEVDILLLSFLESIENDEEKVDVVLELFKKIATKVSSPLVIKIFFSLISPVNGKLRPFFKQLMKTLFELVADAYWKTEATTRIGMKVALDETFEAFDELAGGFSLSLWLLLHESNSTEALIATVIIDDMKVEVLEKNYKIIIKSTIKGVEREPAVCSFTLKRNLWYNIVVSYRKEAGKLCVCTKTDDAEEDLCSLDDVSFRSKTIHLIIGSKDDDVIKSNHCLELGSAFISPPISPLQLKEDICSMPLVEHPQEIKVYKQFISHYSSSNDRSSFNFCLVKLWKFDLALPLFSLFNTPLIDGLIWDQGPSEIIMIFTKAIISNDVAQRNFAESKKLSNVAYLLSQYPPKTLTFDDYMQFFTMYQTFEDVNIKKHVFDEILASPYIWLTISADDHLRILKHWSSVLFPESFYFIDDVRSFKEILCILPLFYWYKSTGSICFGTQNNKRPRDPDLDIKACREEILKCVRFRATISFTSEDLVDLFLVCQNVIEDEEQVVSLLSLAEDLINIYSKNNRNDIVICDFASLQELVTGGSERIVFCVFKTASLMLKRKIFPKQTIQNFFDVLIMSISSMTFTSQFFENCLSLFIGTPELFGLVCCYAVKHPQEREKLYETIVKDQNNDISIDEFCNTPNWFEWPLLLCFKSSGEQQKAFINFLIEKRKSDIINLCCSVDIVSKITDTLNVDDVRQMFIDEIISKIRNSEIVLDAHQMNQFLMFVVSFIFMRFTDTSALKEAFKNSPFIYSESKESQEENNEFIAKNILAKNFTKINFSSDRFFAYRIDEKGEWMDLQLAKSFISLVSTNSSTDLISYALILCYIIAEKEKEFVKSFIAQKNVAKSSHLYSAVKNRIDGKHEPLPVQICEKLFTNIQTQQTFMLDVVEGVKKTHADISAMAFDMINNVSQRNIGKEKLISHVAQNLSINIRASGKKWNQTWSELTANRGPWASAAPKTVQRWRRDDTSCFAYCPLKLKENKHFNDHRDASYKRDNMGISLKKNPETAEQNENAKIAKHKLDKSSLAGVQYVLTLKCKLIKACSKKKGSFALSTSSIDIFFDDYDVILIPLAELKYVYFRTKCHKKTAIEIFTLSGASYFIHFPYLQGTSLDVLKSIRKFAPESVVVQDLLFAPYFKSKKITEHWVNGDISNFEYLMDLNVFSGRSFLDQSQYPIFPVIIKEKEKSSLDFSDQNIYRDLSKPIGALSETRLNKSYEEMHERELMFETEKYLYSNGPVSKLTICIFLLRLEPFTTSHIVLQSGRFDVADRQFSGINDFINSIYKTPNDYREMIPEFYFQPDFLVNSNHFDLGVGEDGRVDDVILPPWAKTPMEYIYLNRKALESDYVSEHISDWIDLLWGYKQRGEEAEKAHNTFLPNLYENAWDGPQVNINVKQIKTFLNMIGQIPPRLFTVPHPKKQTKNSPPLNQVYIFTSPCPDCVFAHFSNRRLILISKNCGIYVFFENIQDNNFSLINIEDSVIKQASYAKFMAGNDLMFSQVGSDFFAGARKGDNSILIFNLKKNAGASIISPHQAITHLAGNGLWYATCGTENATNIYRSDHQRKIFYTTQNYRDGIVCSCISDTHKVLINGTRDHGLVITSLSNGVTVSAIEIGGVPIRVDISEAWGFIVAYIAETENLPISRISVYTINGQLVNTKKIETDIADCCLWTSSKGFDYITLVNQYGKVFVSEVFYLDFTIIPAVFKQPLARLFYSDTARAIVGVEKTGRIVYVPYTPPTW